MEEGCRPEDAPGLSDPGWSRYADVRSGVDFHRPVTIVELETAIGGVVIEGGHVLEP